MKVMLRNLRESDAPYMLEWMHDCMVVSYLKTDFMSKSIDDCITFIRSCLNDCNNLHLAITNQDDTYQGTVSLKNIHDKMAEFAITIRSSAMGTGIAHAAMEQILNIGFREKELDLIYWYVSSENKRAMRFYEKNKYRRIDKRNIEFKNNDFVNDSFYEWFAITRDEWLEDS